MTEMRRKAAIDLINSFASRRPATQIGRELILDYLAEHERMRQFIRNLADESRVYLESDEDN